MKLLFVLWATGVAASVSLGQDKTPRDWWHPVATFENAKSCRDYVGGHPAYAKRMICLRMKEDRAAVAVSQKEQPK